MSASPFPLRQIKEVAGGVVAPRGFLCHAIACGIKDPAQLRLDLALIYSAHPCAVAGTFTGNRVKAAPVRVSMDHVRRGQVRAIIANSGNANACTGPRGIQDAKTMAIESAAALKIRPSQVAVCSTGIIGIPLPMERVTPRIPELTAGLQSKDGECVARAIMTSDTHHKSISTEFRIGKTPVRFGAVAKGAGMICPSMGTMFCFVTTDAAITPEELDKATQCAVEKSFNRISIDGDTSTNDTVLVLANGQARNRRIESGMPSARVFREALCQLMISLAKMLVHDGERVTKFVEIQVRGAATHIDARRVAEAVANSMLVKCSWHGSDPNWGRVMHAIGYSRARRLREELIDIYFDGLIAARGGVYAGTPVRELQKVTAKREFTVTIDLNLDCADYNIFTSDLSQEYVSFNSQEYALGAPKKA
ncbi:MAG: bifunctional glutamate N-acetyltransferase/amino-acid acetyltransferase ArgJ [Verrucomicrobiales bacterium]